MSTGQDIFRESILLSEGKKKWHKLLVILTFPETHISTKMERIHFHTYIH